jgi:hypothetical protein
VTTAHVVITRGSIETLLIDVTDRTGNLTTLAAAAAQFDVFDRAGNAKMSNVAIQTYVAFPMRAGCRVDTTLGGLWTPGKYYLYLEYTANPDAPILGGLEFNVIP